MSTAKVTLIGFYKYYKMRDIDLFKELVLPEGIEKDVLVDNILLRGGEFEVIYTDPAFLSSAIGVWSKKWNRTMVRWIEALNIEYNPLENYDRMEEWNDNESNSANGSTSDYSSGNSSSQSNISAFDSDYLRPNESNSANSSSSGTTSLTNESNRKATKTGRAHGNIGVTTSQQMLESELNISKWNVYEEVTNLFLTEFVIPLY